MSEEGFHPAKQVLPRGSVVGGKYQIDEVLAEGGMGLIYRGWHLVLDQPIVVKVVRPDLSEHPEVNRRFLNEARSAARLRGPNLTRVLDSGAVAVGQSELLYIVFEYLEGEDLGAVLEREGPLPVARAVDFILQVCEGLAEVHRAGIVHRDIKPENLFLTHQPDGGEIIKLLDFGISKRIDASPDSQNSETHSVGSPHYMSPEQMSAPSSVDERGDIWSLGIVAYEILTRRTPFEGDTIATVCAQVFGREPERPTTYRDDLPWEVEEAILKCLHKKREMRPRSVLEFADALAPFGTAHAEERLRRIARLLGHQTSELVLEVGIDLSELSEPRTDERSVERSDGESEPEAISSVDTVEVVVQKPQSVIAQRITLAAAAALALLFSVSGRTTQTSTADFSVPGVQTLSPIGERARQAAKFFSGQVDQWFERYRKPEAETRSQ